MTLIAVSAAAHRILSFGIKLITGACWLVTLVEATRRAFIKRAHQKKRAFGILNRFSIENAATGRHVRAEPEPRLRAGCFIGRPLKKTPRKRKVGSQGHPAGNG